MSSHPFLIWCWHRTGSSVLYKLLATLSEHPDADGEPFDGCGQFSHVPKSPQRDRLLDKLTEQRWTIRHIFYQLPLEFNLALARAATRAGYRHIYLTREPIARAISLAIADQRGTWIASSATRANLDACGKLGPIDVRRMDHLNTRAIAMWQSIRTDLTHVYSVSYEQLFTGSLAHRRETLLLLACFLNLSPVLWRQHAAEFDRLLLHGGQDSQRLRHLIPNLSELRTAITP